VGRTIVGYAAICTRPLVATAISSRMGDYQCMGDKSPKNIHKQAGQKHEKEVEKVQHKHKNAEIQHHPVSGHPVTPAEAEAAAAEKSPS
jgi:hypothetical protein